MATKPSAKDEHGWADEQLERLKALGDDDAIGAYLAGVEPRGPRERELLGELAATHRLDRPEAFPAAHRRVVHGLESLRRHGYRRPMLPSFGPATAVVRYLVELIARYLVVSYVQQVALDLRNLYRLREGQVPVRTPEHTMLRHARRDAEGLIEVFKGRTLGLPTFLIGGAAIPVVAAISNAATGVSKERGWPFLVATVVGLLVAALVSWVVLRGAALAHRRSQIALRVPLENLWQTIGSCGKPPRDDSSSFATIAILITVGAWLVFPVLVLVAFVF
jgi:hypothetical protein